jgi:hypothetical protein
VASCILILGKITFYSTYTQVKVIASIEDPKAIEQNLKHLKQKAATSFDTQPVRSFEDSSI